MLTGNFDAQQNPDTETPQTFTVLYLPTATKTSVFKNIL
jgi:hypothetical protein